MNIKYISGRLIIGLLLICALFFVFAGHEMAIEKGDKKPSGKVLIFSNLYRPNDPVILKVAEMLKKDGNYVKLGSGATLRDMQANKYGAIVIINFIEITTKERSIKVFADENVQKKIVLLNAVGDYLSPGKGRTGSKTVKSEKIAFDIVEKTKVILSNRQKE